jgi:hypothetical protein
MSASEESQQQESNAYDKFVRVLTELKIDFVVTYPEIRPLLDSLNDKECYDFCTEEYPKLFFDILYENDTMFSEPKVLLPGLDFSPLFNDSQITDKTKKTIWKYLQLILFTVIENVESNESFGDTSKIFEAIEANELNKKIAESMEEMKNLFGDLSGEDPTGDVSSNLFGDDAFFNDADKVKSHLDGLMNGKIGSLAKEIAEEATKDFGDLGTHDEFMKNIMKNPTKILDLVKNIGTKLEDKIKSGEVKQSELLEEATEIMKNMKDIPGIKEMMAKMGMGGKMDFKGMANKMQENLKMAKMKERLNKKREDRAKASGPAAVPEDVKISQKDDKSFVVNIDGAEPKQASTRPKNKKKKGSKH